MSRGPGHEHHANAAVFAHTHDAHAATSGERGEHAHRAAMLAVPEHASELAASRERLAVLYRALSGHDGELIAYDEGTNPADLPETVQALHLPARAPIDEHHGLTSPEWYRVAVAHRALHQLLGTFDLDLEAFVHGFAGPALAVEVFVTLEDLRIDAQGQRLLPGLAGSYRLACHEALHDRPPLPMLTARDAVVEALVQFSLGAAGVIAPSALDEPIARVVAAARPLLAPGATAATSAEATRRVYDVLAAVPARAAHRSARAVAFADLPVPPGDPERRADVAASATFHPVPFRDPSGARYATGDAESGLPLQQALLRPAGSDVPGDEQAGDGAPADSGAAGDGTAAAAPHAPPGPPGDTSPTIAAPGGSALDRPSDGWLTARDRTEYVYPEWDGVAGRYLRRWCRVRESRAGRVPAQRGHRLALARYRQLLPGLVSALERVQPSGRDLVRRQSDGDDLDLDACVEAVLDLRAGVEPSDRVFMTTRDRRRDVTVAFALDLSASTGEALPPDRDEPGRTRSVLDLQRDAVSLLVEALDRVGDGYGIYGFSGAGRDDVRLQVVKDLDERRSPGMLDRLAGLRPDHTTRMGAAIRHLTARLIRQDAATKVLLVVSDGRPFDIDYGQQYGEHRILDYAVADTGRALDEARRAGVRPYLVTVDPGGAEYLASMCSPREYHVIADARELPRALADLYVVARTDAFRARGSQPATPAPAGERMPV